MKKAIRFDLLAESSSSGGSSSTRKSVALKLPSVVVGAASEVASSSSVYCARCRNEVFREYHFCAVCGQEIPAHKTKKKNGSSSSGSGNGSSNEQNVAALLELYKDKPFPCPVTTTTTTTKSSASLEASPSSPPAEDLKHLPKKFVDGLNKVLTCFQEGAFNNESREALQRKELLASALELESAVFIEDAYRYLANDKKVKAVGGAVIMPEEKDRTKEQLHALSKKSSNLMLPSLSSSYLPTQSIASIEGNKHLSRLVKQDTIAVAGMYSLQEVRKMSEKEKKKRQEHISGFIGGAKFGKQYLDEVGSVSVYYDELLKREKELEGLRRRVASEEEEQLSSSTSTSSSTAAALFQSQGRQVRSNLGNNLEEEYQDKEEPVAAKTQGGGEEASWFWGPLKEGPARYFLPLSEEERLEAERVEALLASIDGKSTMAQDEEEMRREKEEEKEEEASEEEEEEESEAKKEAKAKKQADAEAEAAARMETERVKAEQELEEHLSRAQTPWNPLLLKDVAEALHLPMLWTHIIRPDGTPPLSRPLTPEPTSDDEDEEFQRELQAKANKLKAAAEGEESGSVAATASDSSSLEEAQADDVLDTSRLEQEAEEASKSSTGGPSGALTGSPGSKAAAGAGVSAAANKRNISSTTNGTGGGASLSSSPSSTLVLQGGGGGGGGGGDQEEEEEETEEAKEQAKAARRAKRARVKRTTRYNEAFSPEKDDYKDAVVRLDKLYVSAVPEEKAFALMGRLFHKSLATLKEAIKQAETRLIDDPAASELGKASYSHRQQNSKKTIDAAAAAAADGHADGHEVASASAAAAARPIDIYRSMLKVVDDAIHAASLADAAARREYLALQASAVKRRSEMAMQVSAALQLAVTYRTSYQERITKMQSAPDTKASSLQKLEQKAEQDIFTAGRELQHLQEKEAQLVLDLKAEEVVAIKEIQHWRPLHAKYIAEASWSKRRLEVMIQTICVVKIQRTAKRRLLMYFRGTPQELNKKLVREKIERKKKHQDLFRASKLRVGGLM